jgi:hypothetical protein
MELDYADQMYIIRVAADQSPADFAKTIIHEMVHVKQYVRRELRYASSRTLNRKTGEYGWVHLWKSISYPDSTPYLKCPWEIEALEYEDIILKSFLDKAPSSRLKSMICKEIG